jgi:hypothetical protein
VAWVGVLYNQGEKYGQNILAHERFHVMAHFEPAYRDYKSAAQELGKPCLTKARAVCLLQVVVDELSKEFEKRSIRDGLEYDWISYGMLQPPDDQQVTFTLMLGAQLDYARAQAATAAAVADCMAQ